MPEFKYKAKDDSGKTVMGQKTASSQENLIIELEKNNFTILAVERLSKEEKSYKKILSNFQFSKGKITTLELIILCKQLAAMLHGGVPIINAIDSITSEIKNRRFKDVLSTVAANIRSGGTLSESFKKHPDVFSALFVAIVEAGEKVGSLDAMLNRLSGYLESRDRLARKIRSATTYPAFIAIFFLFAIAVITLFLIPRFQGIYEGFGAKLPALTLFVFNVSNFFIQNIVLVLMTLIITFSSIFVFVKHTTNGRAVFDKAMLKLPIFGEVIKKAAISKFCRTLSTLLEQGISINEALHLVGRTAGNVIIEDASNKANKLIVEGETIPVAFTKIAIFPSLVLQMTSVGVDSGTLPDLLNKTADFYEEQVDTFVENLTTMIEPILIVSLGAVVAIVVVALYLPIFKLGSAMGGMQ